jgi:hypothetical protein
MDRVPLVVVFPVTRTPEAAGAGGGTYANTNWIEPGGGGVGLGLDCTAAPKNEAGIFSVLVIRSAAP